MSMDLKSPRSWIIIAQAELDGVETEDSNNCLKAAQSALEKALKCLPTTEVPKVETMRMGIRDMTKEENRRWFVLGQWPCCGGSEYLRGPSGGLSVNIECPSCGMRLNVMDPDIGVGQGGRGQVIREPASYTPPPDLPDPPSFPVRVWNWLYKFLSQEVK